MLPRPGLRTERDRSKKNIIQAKLAILQDQPSHLVPWTELMKTLCTGAGVQIPFPALSPIKLYKECSLMRKLAILPWLFIGLQMDTNQAFVSENQQPLAFHCWVLLRLNFSHYYQSLHRLPMLASSCTDNTRNKRAQNVAHIVTIVLSHWQPLAICWCMEGGAIILSLPYWPSRKFALSCLRSSNLFSYFFRHVHLGISADRSVFLRSIFKCFMYLELTTHPPCERLWVGELFNLHDLRLCADKGNFAVLQGGVLHLLPLKWKGWYCNDLRFQVAQDALTQHLWGGRDESKSSTKSHKE